MKNTYTLFFIFYQATKKNTKIYTPKQTTVRRKANKRTVFILGGKSKCSRYIPGFAISNQCNNDNVLISCPCGSVWESAMCSLVMSAPTAVCVLNSGVRLQLYGLRPFASFYFCPFSCILPYIWKLFNSVCQGVCVCDFFFFLMVAHFWQCSKFETFNS